MAQIDIETVESLSIIEASVHKQKPISELVSSILDLTKSDDYLSNTGKQAKVLELEDKIDKLVYALYGLTSDEVNLIQKPV